MHLPCLVVNLIIIESEFAVNCHHFILFHKCNKYKFMLGKLRCFSWKIITFDVVYILVFLHCKKKFNFTPNLVAAELPLILA